MDDLRPRFLEETAATAAAAARMLGSRKATGSGLAAIAGEMRAIRGIAGLLHLPRIGAIAQAIEDALAIASGEPDPGLIQALRAGCQRLSSLVREAGEREAEGSDDDVLGGLAAMAGAAQRLERARLFAGRVLIPQAPAQACLEPGPESRSWLLADALRHLDEFAGDLADEAGRNIRFSLETDGVRASERVLAALVPTLVQLIRNAVTHGVESQPERLAAGKKPAGHIVLSARRQGRRLAIEVADDGRGINPQRVGELAASGAAMPSANAAARSADARLRLVFAPGFTTVRRRSASVVRGYGLDAAAGRIAALGGTIAIRSAPGEGTVFTILLPDGPARSRVRRPAGKRSVALGEPVAALPAAPSWS